jgi:hypothetical protein
MGDNRPFLHASLVPQGHLVICQVIQHASFESITSQSRRSPLVPHSHHIPVERSAARDLDPDDGMAQWMFQGRWEWEWRSTRASDLDARILQTGRVVRKLS